jgi:hypothetical protein
METDSPEEVLLTLRNAIEGDPRFAGEFEPMLGGIRREGEWWFVPVTLLVMKPIQRRMELYAKFAELENYLQATKNLQVLLLPVITAKTA